MPGPIKRRRPAGWNALLIKGHAHTVSRSKGRTAQQQSMEDEAADYLNERLVEGKRAAQSAKEGAERTNPLLLAAAPGLLQYWHTTSTAPDSNAQHYALSRPYGLLQSLSQRAA